MPLGIHHEAAITSQGEIIRSTRAFRTNDEEAVSIDRDVHGRTGLDDVTLGELDDRRRRELPTAKLFEQPLRIRIHAGLEPLWQTLLRKGEVGLEGVGLGIGQVVYPEILNLDLSKFEDGSQIKDYLRDLVDSATIVDQASRRVRCTHDVHSYTTRQKVIILIFIHTPCHEL